MRNRMSAKFSNCFLFLMVGFLMLCNPINSYAQNSSINVGGTEWQTEQFKMANEDDDSIIVITSTYIFDKQGKVILFVEFEKSAGRKNEFIASTPSYDPQIHSPSERRLVLTPPKTSTSEEFGAYKINCKSISLDFLTYTISATIYGDSMKGILTHKGTNKKEEWIVARRSNQNVLSTKESTITSSNKSNTTKPQKVLTQQIVDKYNPTKITSNIISGELLKGESDKYFYFIAVPGELTVTLIAKAGAKSYLNMVTATFLDPNESLYGYEKILSFGRASANFGGTNQNIQKISFSEKMLVLLHIKSSNLETGSYKVELDGAVESSVSKSEQQTSNANGESPALTADDLRFLADLGDIPHPQALYKLGVAKEGRGDKVGACHYFRQSCELGFNDACKKVGNSCKQR